MELHPAEQFAAPSSIEKGAPLKDLMGRKLVTLIGRSLSQAVPGFAERRFVSRALRGLDALELKDRAANIAAAMAEQLPAAFDELAPLLIRSFGPPLSRTEGNGLAPFFYFPHSHLIATQGVEHFESGMAANHQITQRFTAEFCIRPFLVRHRDRCLATLKRWAKDDSDHVRRLVSEGTRPLLPWGMRLKEFQADPTHTLSLLEMLKDDPSLYVRRSVANHIGDIAKDHPQVALELCRRWLGELKKVRDETAADNRRWIVRHALRHPAGKGNAEAMKVRAAALRSTR